MKTKHLNKEFTLDNYSILRMKNDKRGIAPIALVMAVFIGIVLLIFLAGGGLKTAFDVSKFISSVPTIVWIILGIIILLKLIGGKKR